MELPFSDVHWNWVMLGVLLLTAEVFLSGFFLIWPGIAALVVAVITLMHPTLGVEAQLLTFAGLSILSVAAWLAYRKRHPEPTSESGLNKRGSEHIGRIVTLDEGLQGGRGKVTLDGIPWLISGPDYPAGTQVRIAGLEGTRLLVERVHDH